MYFNTSFCLKYNLFSATKHCVGLPVFSSAKDFCSIIVSSMFNTSVVNERRFVDCRNNHSVNNNNINLMCCGYHGVQFDQNMNMFSASCVDDEGRILSLGFFLRMEDAAHCHGVVSQLVAKLNALTKFHIVHRQRMKKMKNSNSNELELRRTNSNSNIVSPLLTNSFGPTSIHSQKTSGVLYIPKAIANLHSLKSIQTDTKKETSNINMDET